MLDIHTKREIKVKHSIVVYWFFNFLSTVLVCPCVLKGTMSFSQIFNFHSPYVSLRLLLINLMTLGIPWRNYQEKKKSLLTIWIYSCYHNHLGFFFLLTFTHWLLKLSQNSLLMSKVESHFIKFLLCLITREKFSSFSFHFYFYVGKVSCLHNFILKFLFFNIKVHKLTRSKLLWFSSRLFFNIWALTITNKLMKLKWNQFLRAFCTTFFFFFLDV